MKKYFILICIVFFSSFSVSSAQLLKIGFRIEPTILISEQNHVTSTEFNPYSVYLTVATSPIKDLSFGIIPGYLLWADYYSGFEIGAFVKWNVFSSKIFVKGGLSNHNNSGGEHNGGGSYERSIVYKGLGAGYQIDRKLSVDITYYWSDEAVYGHSRLTDDRGYYYTENIRMKGILKLGFCLLWDII